MKQRYRDALDAAGLDADGLAELVLALTGKPMARSTPWRWGQDGDKHPEPPPVAVALLDVYGVLRHVLALLTPQQMDLLKSQAEGSPQLQELLDRARPRMVGRIIG